MFYWSIKRTYQVIISILYSTLCRSMHCELFMGYIVYSSRNRKGACTVATYAGLTIPRWPIRPRLFITSPPRLLASSDASAVKPNFFICYYYSLANGQIKKAKSPKELFATLSFSQAGYAFESCILYGSPICSPRSFSHHSLRS